jgi:hypothetical protein
VALLAEVAGLKREKVIIILVHPGRHRLPVIRPAEELDLSDRDIIAEAGLSVSGLVAPGLETSLNVDLLTLAEVLITGFCQFPEGRAVEPFGLVALFTRDSLVLVVGCQTKDVIRTSPPDRLAAKRASTSMASALHPGTVLLPLMREHQLLTGSEPLQPSYR